MLLLHLISWLIVSLQWTTNISFHVIVTVNSIIWNCLVLATTIGGYFYIITATLYRRRKLSNGSIGIPPLRINYTIPLCITITFICFMVIPNIVLSSSEELQRSSIWFLVVFRLNMISDPLTYILVIKFKSIKSRSSRKESRKSIASISYSTAESNFTTGTSVN